MATDDGSFVSRWSRRKAQARTGTPMPADSPAAPTPQPVPLPPPVPAVVAPTVPAAMPASAEAQVPPPPTLADVAQLTPASDYSRFVACDVAPEVKNAALKKLFSEPHFNVMDGLDTYIDDYHTPDPLPPGMLRRMVQSQLLGLFADEETEAPAIAASPAAAAVAAPLPCAPAGALAHEDPDLQLQPDDDAGRPGTEPGAGADPGREH